MQISAPAFVVSLFFTLYSILLVMLVGAVLSIISTFRPHIYLGSIRFALEGDFLEILSTFSRSRRPVPRKTLNTFMLIIVASFIPTLLRMIMSTQVQRSQDGSDPGLFISKTYQVVTSPGGTNDWTTFLGGGGENTEGSVTVEGVFNRLLASPQYILDIDIERQYTPKMYNDDAHSAFACRNFGAALSKNDTVFSENIVNGSCAWVYFDLQVGLFQWNLTNTTVLATRPPNTSTVVMVTIHGYFWDTDMAVTSPIFYIASTTKACIFADEASQNIYTQFPTNGMTTPPSTNMFRCKYPTGEMLILAPTYFVFAVNPIDQFSYVTGTIFDTDDDLSMPLIQTMQKVINNGTFVVNTFNSTLNSTMVVLTDAITASPLIHYLSCNSRWLAASNDLGLICAYIVVDAAITTQQPSDPIMTTAIGPRPVTQPPSFSNNTNRLVIKHLASGSAGSSGLAVFNVTNILAVTNNVTTYASQLGPNFFVDKDQQQVYILYETVKLKNVYVMADGVFWSMVGTMVFSFLVWALTKWRLGYKYTGSLLTILHAEIQPILAERALTAARPTTTTTTTTTTTITTTPSSPSSPSPSLSTTAAPPSSSLSTIATTTSSSPSPSPSPSSTTTMATMTTATATVKKVQKSAMLMHVEFQPLRLDGVPILRNRALPERAGTMRTEDRSREVSGAAIV